MQSVLNTGSTVDVLTWVTLNDVTYAFMNKARSEECENAQSVVAATWQLAASKKIQDKFYHFISDAHSYLL